MKKHLIAAAVAAAVAAPAMAQNVTVNGLLDVGILNTKTTGAASVTTMNSNQRSTQFIGFEGTEDLGGGLKAKFQVRTGFDTDTAGNATGQIGGGARQLGDQNAWLGLEVAGVGEFRAGRDLTPQFQHAASFAAFGTGFQNIRGYVNTGAPDARWNNSIGYTSVTWNGLQLQAAIAQDNDTSTYRPFTVGSTGTVTAALTNKNQPYAVRATYTNGNLRLGVAYTEGSAIAASAATVGAQKSSVINYGASYNLGFATVMGQYEQDKSITAATGDSAYVLAATAPVPGTAITLRAQTAKRDTLSTGTATFGGAAVKSGYAVGADYALSKRTTAYLFVGNTKNNQAETTKSESAIVGMVHSF